ncbi:copper resistance CopC family protein [Streptomyces europaeiscabiei]|uniref:copper resistance CopC family protein n=1 Tax=Streptomyces europaeiscabiei TaxID=146819 RepID=UPI00299FA5B0|nr:copper resistance protein CopC [Streptomyces europaeiscabiei]MDX2528264.1 copper resistance protein CopC [Streptomyces europaeiscabiei]MDX3711005.1 copper resistance protein CopC [Streptomyces europaeiscabiei]MDX3834997.1 copper resistance protein CopC [Streptomyces europaeiscabiei]
MRRLRLLRPHVALLGCLCALLFLGSTNAYAHTSLTEAAPGPGATVGPGAEVVSLTFGPLKSGTTPTIGLIGPDGTDVPVGEPVVADGSVVCAAVTSLPTGVNTLNYTVISADGDTQSSAFQFEVADGARTVTAPSVCQHLGLSAPAVDASAADGTFLGLGRTTAMTVLAGTVVVIVGSAVLAVHTRRRSRTTNGGKATA